MKKIFAMFMLCCMASVAAAPVKMRFFFQEGCQDCDEVESVLERIQAKYGSSIIIERVSVLSSSGFEEFRRYGFEYTPALVVEGKKFQGKETMTYERLSSLLDNILNGFSFRLTPALFLLLGAVSALSPTTQSVISILLATLARRRRSLGEALAKSFLVLFFFCFLAYFLIVALHLILNLFSDHPYYVSSLLAFIVASCALIFLNGAANLVSPHDFSKSRVRKIKTMIPRGIPESVSLSLYVFAYGFIVMVPAFSVAVADNFYSYDFSTGIMNTLFLCSGFLLASFSSALIGCFAGMTEWFSENKLYSLLFTIASSILLLLYSGMIFRYVLTLQASATGMAFTFVLTVLFFALLGWSVGYWRR